MMMFMPTFRLAQTVHLYDLLVGVDARGDADGRRTASSWLAPCSALHAKLEQRGAAMESNDVNRTPPCDSALEVRVHLVHVPRLGAVGGGSGITSPFRVGYPLQISLPHRPSKHRRSSLGQHANGR